jgi:hypothetical protein
MFYSFYGMVVFHDVPLVVDDTHDAMFIVFF